MSKVLQKGMICLFVVFVMGTEQNAFALTMFDVTIDTSAIKGKNANVFYERSNRPTAANRPKVAQKNSLEISYLVGAT